MVRVLHRALTAGCLVGVLGLAAGCGADEEVAPAKSSTPRSDRLVDFSQQPPYVNGLEIDPVDKSFLLTTNRGFFRVSPDGKTVAKQTATVKDPSGTSPLGTFLEISSLGDGSLVGSGHPDDADALPPYLGFMQSRDRGATWSVLSRLGEADFHQIREDHDRLYAFDAVLGGLLISTDGGREWEERPTPRGLVLDFVVDPEDPDYLLTSNDEAISRTTDQGKSFRKLEEAPAARMDWPAREALMRADKDGAFYVSTDRGDSWEKRGDVGGEAYRVKAVDAKQAYVALSDGTITETTDGGATWKARFTP